MSAFIVDAKTINRILSFLAGYRDGHSWNARKVREAGFTLPEASDRNVAMNQLQELGAAMLALNTDAVRARYPGEPDSDLPGPINAPPYRFAWEPSTSRYQATKSLKCWLYQCSEGDIPERPLFRALDTIADGLAWDIVGRVPQYDAAEWG